MGLSSTAALVNLKDSSGATTAVANGATVQVSPSGVLSFSLQSTQGVAVWTISIQASNYPGLNGTVFTWNNGQANLMQVQLPPGDSFVGQFLSTVSDGQASVQYATGFLSTKGAYSVPVQHIARMATNAALAAYTNVSGVITANGNGVMAAVDGVTPVVGDLLLLTMGAAAADNGLYQVTSIGTAGAPFILTRAPDWGNGSLLNAGTTVEVSEGTLFTGMTWKVMTTGTSTVGTTGVSIYPQFSTITTGAAVAGVTPANALNWVFSTTNPVLAVPVTSGGTQGIWKISTQTAGAPGTSSLVATSSSGTDTSTVKLTSINW